MELTSSNVVTVVKDCLFDAPPDDPSKAVIVEGVMAKFGFDPAGLERNKDNIVSMLQQLPDVFMEKNGGGYTFLNGCLRKDGSQWGEQRSVDELLCLGLAIKRVCFCAPRDLWGFFPGGVPYFFVTEG